MKYMQGIITGASLMLCFFLMVGAKEKTTFDHIEVNTLLVNDSISVYVSDNFKTTIRPAGIIIDALPRKEEKFLLDDPIQSIYMAGGLFFNKGTETLMSLGLHRPVRDVQFFSHLTFYDILSQAEGVLQIDKSNFTITGVDAYGELSFGMSSKEGNFFNFKK